MKLLQLLLAAAVSLAAADPAAAPAQFAWQPNQVYYHVVPQQQQQPQQQHQPFSYNFPFYVSTYAKVRNVL